MAEAPLASAANGAAGGGAIVLGAAGWLSLAAAPTFALMALWVAFANPDPMRLCASGQGASSLGGMAAMYALMSAFHLGPWLRWWARIWRAG